MKNMNDLRFSVQNVIIRIAEKVPDEDTLVASLNGLISARHTGANPFMQCSNKSSST